MLEGDEVFIYSINVELERCLREKASFFAGNRRTRRERGAFCIHIWRDDFASGGSTAAGARPGRRQVWRRAAAHAMRRALGVKRQLFGGASQATCLLDSDPRGWFDGTGLGRPGHVLGYWWSGHQHHSEHINDFRIVVSAGNIDEFDRRLTADVEVKL